jgi:hypothetical protein
MAVMKALCKTDERGVSFVFADVDLPYQDAVRGLFYSPVAEGFAKTFPPGTADLDRIYRNFRRHAEEMVLQAARVRPVPWEEALSAFLQAVEGASIDWWLTGGAALAVRGVEVNPGDLDLVTDEAGASRLAALLAEDLV